MRLLLAALAAVLAIPAQEGPQTPAPLAIKVDVSLVNVAFIVRDSAGRLTGNLTRDDIEVFEDGVKQEVRFFSRSADLPLRLALLADFSGSQAKFIRQHRHDLESFVRAAVTPRDQAMLVCFGNHIRLVSDFVSRPDDLMSALDLFQDGKHHFDELAPDPTRSGGTALFDAIFHSAAGKLSAASEERRAILLFSDGEDNASAHDLMDAIEAAQTAGAAIYTIRYTESKHGELTARNRYGIREMERFATESGGAAFDASKGHVSDALRQVGEELRSTYDVGYISANPERDGTFRKVTIRARREGLTIRSKPGYWNRPGVNSVR